MPDIVNVIGASERNKAVLFISHFIGFFMIQWQIIDALRIQGSTHRRLVLNDYLYIYLSSCIVAILQLTSSHILTISLFLILSLIFILQWVNIIVFRFYGIKVNTHILKAFFSGMSHFQHEAFAIWPELLQDNKLLLFLPMSLLLYADHFFLSFPASMYFYTVYLIYFIAVITKSKIDRKSSGLWLMMTILLLGACYFFMPIFDVITSSILLICAGIAILGLLLLMILTLRARHQKSPFYHLSTMLTHQFRDDSLSLAILNQSPTLSNVSKADEALSHFIPQSSIPSHLQGQCEQASIILITVESLSGFYFRDPSLQQRYLPFYSKLQQQGVKSQCHISPSALTNNMCKVVYGGSYHGEEFPHLHYLQQAGYQTCFLTSQKATEFNMDKLLAKIGFDRVIDNITVSGDKAGRMPDPLFFDAATQYLEQAIDLEKPFFLHIMNNQTHGPYFTYEKKILDRKERYQQAVMEADQTLEKFITQLQQRFDLKNTIIIYTGDHGESFGEEGYTSHANSIIQPQIEVPFVLSHPKLSASTVSLSNHFDIFPTLFDLLGMRYDYPVLGNSLYQSSRQENCLVYSETRMGNTPSSFGLVTPDKKIYFDRQMSHYQIRDANDQAIEDLSGERYDYYLKLLLSSLNTNQLIT